MALPTPAAGKTHHLVISYANGTKQIGLMLPDGDLSAFVKQPYTPFAPAMRQGDATQRDFNVTATWEQFNSLHMGTGHLIEQDVEFPGYAFAQGLDMSGTTTIGPCLFTGQHGKVLPPAADVSVSSIANFTKFIEFNGRVYAATSDSAGKIYQFDASGLNPSLKETLTAACTQLFTDGTTLYACQGASNPVRKTTDGSSWSNHSFNAHFIAKREEDNTAYITTATLTPNNDGTGPSYRSPPIGLSGTTATNMVYYKEKLWIGKPEGLYTWQQGWIKRVDDASTQRDTSNYKFLAVHNGLLYFNVKNRLFFTQGGSITEIVPEDLNTFTAIDSMFASAGPLLLGVRMQGRSYLMWFNGAADPGLNPIWSDADASRPIVGCAASDLTGTEQHIYFCQTTTGTRYLDFKQDWTPKTYHTLGSVASYVQLTKFTAGFRSVPKWWYEVVLNVDDPVSSTRAIVYYRIDDGSWTQMVDEDGNAVTLTLSASNVGCFFPLNTVGTKLELRLYIYSTSSSVAASVTHLTVRGTVMVKRRNQFAFPVLATEKVQGLTTLAEDSGVAIKAAIAEMVAQNYPVKLQDFEGNWHLCLPRTPYPVASIQNARNPDGNHALKTDDIIQMLLVELDPLDTDASYLAWSAG